MEGWRPPYWLRNVYPLAPSGFAWGHDGAGTTALAQSLLEDALGDIDEAEMADLAASAYVKEVIAKLDQKQAWEIREQQILDWFRSWRGRYADFGIGDGAVLSRRVAWALRQAHPADEDLRGLIMRDLGKVSEVRESLQPAWDMTKLEVAAFVSAWLRTHPTEVDAANEAWVERPEVWWELSET